MEMTTTAMVIQPSVRVLLNSLGVLVSLLGALLVLLGNRGPAVRGVPLRRLLRLRVTRWIRVTFGGREVV